jgi:hypothetical protein
MDAGSRIGWLFQTCVGDVGDSFSEWDNTTGAPGVVPPVVVATGAMGGVLPLAVATAGAGATPEFDDMFHSGRREGLVQTGTRRRLN